MRFFLLIIFSVYMAIKITSHIIFFVDLSIYGPGQRPKNYKESLIRLFNIFFPEFYFLCRLWPKIDIIKFCSKTKELFGNYLIPEKIKDDK